MFLESVNVGTPREIRYRGKPMTTAIWKFPVTGPVVVRGVNLTGDDQADRRVHGGPEQALYAYAREDIDWWEGQLGRRLESGTFGENLTTKGVDVTNALVGERWRFGTVVVEVRQPRLPCFKLGIRMGSPYFPKRFTKAERPGAYFRIVEEGELAAGMPIEIVHRPEHDVTMALIARARQIDQSLAPKLLTAPGLPEYWRSWAESLV
jgi:MOSC domain-containing protein YiiM